MNVRRILCIRPDGLGDMICATPVFACLDEAFPEASLSVLASPLNAPLLVGNPHVDEVVLYEPKGKDRSWPRRLRTLREIQRRQFDLVLAMRTSWDSHLFAGLSGARYRVGYAEKPFGSMLTHRLVGGHRRGQFHEVDRNLNLLDVLGVPRKTRKPRLYLLDKEKQFAEEWLQKRSCAEGALWGVHAGASTGDRCYPEDRYAEALNLLAEGVSFPVRVLVFGGPGDEERVAVLCRELKMPYEKATGLTVRELMALMARCRLMLVNDSGPMHIAAGLDVPLVALFGPGDHVRWMPENENTRLLRPDPCRPGALPPVAGRSNLYEIPATWVVEAARSLVEAKASSRETEVPLSPPSSPSG